ncbi:hypothetical protein [Tsukamurella paurometabola]|uniref:Uncharacterized protein n=1 Tax=Tsukamurella paurometabola TaxID=2061 RepID=A0ABS5NJS6_TSUPA|nr:hypothetical protein [Tsukamurella paurometabola]MBS4104544.1 hypothetical protein [Tsukamurella paurometabola]
MSMKGWRVVVVAAIVLAGILLGGVIGAYVMRPIDVPRPGAPRANDSSPCVDCRVLPPVNTLGVVIKALVTDSVRRPTLGVCPAGFRADGARGRDGVCPSETTFRVAMELLPGTHVVPGRAPAARCDVGSDATFTLVSVRDASSAYPGANTVFPVRDQVESSCDAVRRAQPELVGAAFEVQQLVWLQRYSAETLDTATQRIVVPERTIGYHRTDTLEVVGVKVTT